MAAAHTTGPRRPPGRHRRISILLVVVAVMAAPDAAAAVDLNPINWVTDGVGSVMHSAAGDAVQALTGWVASGAAWAAAHCLTAATSTADPQPGTAWFAASYQRMALVAGVFASGCLVLGITQAALQRDAALLGRVAAAVPVSVLITTAAVATTRMLLATVDQLSRWLLAASGQQVPAFATRMTLILTRGDPTTSMFVVFVVATVTVVAALVLWVELLVRSALVYVLLGFLPVAATLMIWPATATAISRLVRLLAAVVFSKLAICGVLSIALAAIAASGSQDRLQSLLAGTAMLVVAAFAPVAVLRMLPLVEEAVRVRGATSSAAQATLRAVDGAAGHLTSVQNAARQLGFVRGLPDHRPVEDHTIRFVRPVSAPATSGNDGDQRA
jgi:hypothetical protein